MVTTINQVFGKTDSRLPRVSNRICILRFQYVVFQLSQNCRLSGPAVSFQAYRVDRDLVSRLVSTVIRSGIFNKINLEEYVELKARVGLSMMATEKCTLSPAELDELDHATLEGTGHADLVQSYFLFEAAAAHETPSNFVQWATSKVGLAAKAIRSMFNTEDKQLQLPTVTAPNTPDRDLFHSLCNSEVGSKLPASAKKLLEFALEWLIKTMDDACMRCVDQIIDQQVNCEMPEIRVAAEASLLRLGAAQLETLKSRIRAAESLSSSKYVVSFLRS
jgi:hypothetical protein